MGQKALDIMEFQSLDEFLAHHSDVYELIPGFEMRPNISFLEEIFNAPQNSKKVILRNRNQRTFSVVLKANHLSYTNNQRFYELDMQVDQEIFEDSKQLVQDQLRMPMLIKSHTHLTIHNKDSHNFAINPHWIEDTSEILGIDKHDFIEYLDIFIKSSGKLEISLQNAIMTQDILSIKRIIAGFKEPAQNLHIRPLVKIYNEIISNNTSNYRELLQQSKEYIKELAKVVKQEKK